MSENIFVKHFKFLSQGLLNIYLNNPLSKKIKLYKINKALTVVDISKVKEITAEHFIKKDTISLNEDKKEIRKYLENFLKVMNENFEEQDLINLYDNITWLTVRRNIFLNSDGEYNVCNNSITYHKNNDPDSLNHELLHLSANPINENNINSGFTHVIDGVLIGTGLDEGYTELLNKRYFNSKSEDTYETEMFAAKQLEKLVGQKNMQKYYLTSNLYKLIKSLEKYYSLEEIERFIRSLDFINTYDEKTFLSNIELKEYYSQLDNICKFLFKGFCKTIVINNEEIKAKMNNYVKHMTKNLDYEIDEYLINEFNSIIEKNLDNNKIIKLSINSFKSNKNVL